MSQDKRVSVVLTPVQLSRLTELQEEMDIDMSRLIRWCIDSCFDIGTHMKELHSAIGPEHSGILRSINNSRTNFLLDTIAEHDYSI